MNSTSIFQVVGVVVRDAHQGPNFSYVTIREGEKSYWDVACFEDGPLNDFRQLRSGAVAKVRGHLAKRKVKGYQDPTGRDKYEIQLVADHIRALAPLVPTLPAQYNHQPTQYGYHQPKGPWAGPPQHAQVPQQPQHPGAMAPGDDLPPF